MKLISTSVRSSEATIQCNVNSFKSQSINMMPPPTLPRYLRRLHVLFAKNATFVLSVAVRNHCPPFASFLSV